MNVAYREVPAGDNANALKKVLTSQEILLLDALINIEGNTLSRDDLAQKIWGLEWEDKYSDWAIDKLVSNLRKKLELNFYPKTLKTIKNKGFMLV